MESTSVHSSKGRQVVVYTRPGCHLCDEAISLLRQYGLHPQLVNIESDAGLLDKYSLCIPVVEVDGRERFRGRISEPLLRRLLASTR